MGILLLLLTISAGKRRAKPKVPSLIDSRCEAFFCESLLDGLARKLEVGEKSMEVLIFFEEEKEKSLFSNIKNSLISTKVCVMSKFFSKKQ